MEVAAAGRPGVAVLVYDGDCAGCRAAALWIMRCALGAGTLEVLPIDSGPRRRRFPALDEAAARRAMALVLPGGRVVSGREAVPALLARVPRWRWRLRLLGLPGFRRWAPAVHARTASRLGLVCGEAAGGG